MVEQGDVVKIDYVGRIQGSGEIFDVTSEAAAAEEGVDTQDLELGPVNVLVGAGHVIDGLDTVLQDMDEGDHRTVAVPAEEAFGERRSDSIETFSRREFDQHDVEPRRGLVVEIDGRRGKIVSASSGRIRVDFNHPLAGKDLEYEVDLLTVIDDVADRVRAVLDYYGIGDEVTMEDGTATIKLPDEVTAEFRDRLQDELEQVNGVDAVAFT